MMAAGGEKDELGLEPADAGGTMALPSKATRPDPRDPDHSRIGIFVYHNCSRCADGALPCVQGNPNRCDIPHARND